MTRSALSLQPHQRPADSPEHGGRLGPAKRPTLTVKPVRQPFEHRTPVSAADRIDQIDREDGQDLGQPMGRQFGRGARRRRREG